MKALVKKVKGHLKMIDAHFQVDPKTTCCRVGVQKLCAVGEDVPSSILGCVTDWSVPQAVFWLRRHQLPGRFVDDKKPMLLEIAKTEFAKQVENEPFDLLKEHIDNRLREAGLLKSKLAEVCFLELLKLLFSCHTSILSSWQNFR